ncbi:hypothetical protein C8D87_102779 [Lentzea atacamensis]|uniref:Uncharacterized protein n=1 Tax=Lentzea atacamensis TaxID=531938 RepID=A0ABX9EGD4_9PSEU|nr:hypothetical protein [Lentzea atacamensis]RAS68706.1 hypothetical protein C8D87_102779 [Lentzea atacamensis]
MTSPAQQWHQEHTQRHAVGKRPKITKLGIVVTTVFLVRLGVVEYFSFRNDPPSVTARRRGASRANGSTS